LFQYQLLEIYFRLDILYFPIKNETQIPADSRRFRKKLVKTSVNRNMQEFARYRLNTPNSPVSDEISAKIYRRREISQNQKNLKDFVADL
jgi:hypothetical protein